MKWHSLIPRLLLPAKAGYAVMAYTVTYAVTSLIQIQPMCRQHSEGEDPEALSLSLHDCVLLLWIFSIPLTCRSFMVCSSWQKWATTGFSGFLVLMLEWCPLILMPHFFRFFVLHEMLLLMCYFLPVIQLLNVLPVTISWKHLHFLN